MESPEKPVSLPSWLLLAPNCCETCVGWERHDTYTGRCQKHNSLDVSTITDTCYCCPAFQRKPDNDTSPK